MFRFAFFRSILVILTVLGCLCASGRAQTAYTGHLIGGQFFSYSPYGGAVDASGNFYFFDQLSQTVLEIPPGCVDTSCTKTLGGPSSFSYATGVAVDGSGNVYVADTNEGLLKEIPAGCFDDGCVLTLAGGTLIPAIYAVAVDGVGNLYFSDVNANTVYEMTPGCTTTACITPLGFGVNGFSQPTGIAVDTSGNVYVADDGDATVYRMTPNCTTAACVTTLGSGFSQPFSVALDRFNNVYVADYYAGQVYEMPPGCPDSTCMTTVGGGYYGPTGLAVDSNSNVFVSDYTASAVREVVRSATNAGSVAANTSTPAAFTVTFTFSSNGSDVGTPAVVTQGAPDLDFTDVGTGTCNNAEAGHFYTVGDTCTVDVNFVPRFSGQRFGAVVLRNTAGAAIATAQLYGVGTGPQITFSPVPATEINTTANSVVLNQALGQAVDANGNLYIADTSNNRIVVVPAGGGTPTSFTVSANGAGLSAPCALAFDGAGNLFIADLDNNRIVEVSAFGGAVTAFNPGLNGPDGLAFDSVGNLYISDDFNNRVVEIPVGSVSPVVINPNVDGNTLSGPSGLAVDGAGNLYISDTNHHRIIEVPAGGGAAVSIAPTVDGKTLKYPADVALDAAGDLYIADFLNSRVVEIPAGGGSPFAISPTVNGHGIKYAQRVTLDGAGNLFILDYINSTVGTRVLNLPYSQVPALSFPTSTPAGSTDTADGIMTVQVANVGNQSLDFTAVTYPADFSAAGDPSACTGATSLLAGQACDLPVEFTPETVGSPLSESITLTDNALNVPGSTQTISLSGTAIVGPVTHFVLDAPNPVGSYNTYQLTITAEDAGGNTVTSYNGTVALSSSDPRFVNLGNVTFSNGIGIQNFALKTAGTQSITATDTSDSLLTGTVDLTVVPGPAQYLGISVPSSAYAGSPMSITVTAYDLVLNVATSYTGTVHFTSSDSAAVLPADYTFVAGDNGVHSFSATLKTPGAQSITTTDSADGLAPGSGNIDVTIPALVVTTAGDDAGDASDCTVQTTPGTGTDASCSLRDALLEAASLGSSDITFDTTAFATPQTIAETNGTMTIPANTSITGVTSGGAVTVQGSSSGPVFSLAAGLTASISNLTITGASGPSGSGIRNTGALTVSNSTISNNNSAVGGGIYTAGGTLTVSNSTISGNQATDSGGGGIYVGSGIVNIATSTFSGNTSTSGGGLLIAAGTVTVTNSTFSGNAAAAFGGGVFNQSTSVTVTDSTFSGNTASLSGGGVFNTLIMTFANSILAGNSAAAFPDFEGGATDAGHNLIGIGSSAGFNNGVNGTQVGTSASPINPMLSSLGNYGGPTQTMLPQLGSPALCAGSPSLIPSGVITDQRGFPNTNTTYPGFSPGSPCVDIGAVQTNYAIEFSQQPSTSSTTATLSVNLAISPAPAVSVTESGMAISGALVTLTDAAGALSGPATQPSVAGTATFSGLSIGAAESGDTLTATLAGLNLTATSYPFDVTFVPPQLTSPTPTSTLGGSTATFSWNPGSATTFKFRLGKTFGGDQVYASWITTDTAKFVSNLPTNGLTLYARLYYLEAGVWKFVDYTFTESGAPVAASLISPAPGSTLTGPSQTFTWDRGGGPTAFELHIGTKGTGSSNIFKSGWTNKPSVDVPNIPVSGSTLYVRLLYELNGVWSSIDYTYTEQLVLPSMTTPAPSSTLTGSSQIFTWDAGGASAFELNVGTKGPGSGNVFKSGWTNSTTATAPTIPTTGGTLNVRLSYKLNGVWSHIDYTYTEF